jgi:hypothetical protein
MQLHHLLFLATTAIAVPGCPFQKRQAESANDLHKRQLPLSANEHNSGPFDSTVFNAQEQFVDVRPGTTHEYRAPGSGDKRGPCPGLNAAANHGFLPRNGITSIQQSTY